MFGKVSSADTVFAKLLSEIENHKKSDKKNYPVKLRQQIVDYIDNSKCTRKVFSERSGIPVASLGRWHKEESCRVDPECIHPMYHAKNPPKEKIVEEEKVTIKVDGIEIEVPIKYIGKILKQLKEPS
jgi:hypothetical protein